MCERQQRGLVIAATCKIEKKGAAWLVPSQSGAGRYTVLPDPESPHCSCPDHETRGVKCKHLFAVEFVQKREQNADGSITTTTTLTVVETVRPTYKQDWANYNAAQTNERRHFMDLLGELCGTVPCPPPKPGHPKIPPCDAAFSAILKVFSLKSARRFAGELQEAGEKGYIRAVPHFNSVLNFFDTPEGLCT